MKTYTIADVREAADTRMYDDPNLPVCPQEDCDENDWRYLVVADCVMEASLSPDGGGLSYDSAEWERYSGDDIDGWWECASGHRVVDINLAMRLQELEDEGDDES